MSRNEALTARLDEIASLMELLGEDSFRASAHARAARVIADLPDDIGAYSREQVLALPGIGAKIADKVMEFIASGSIAELDDLRARVPPGLPALLRIPGLGPKTVRVLWQQGGVTDADSLQRAIDDGSLLALPRMGEKAIEKIKTNLHFARESTQRLWLGRAAAVADVFLRRLRALPAVARAEVAGSVRRGKETIGDIDILVALRAGHAADAPAVAAAFTSTPGVVQVLASGEGRSSVRVALDHDHGRWGAPRSEGDAPPAGPSIQVDLRVLPESSWGAALMYFTGSKEHNVRLRERALARGLTLSEWGLFPNDDEPTPPHTRGVRPVAAATEADVYAALDLPWIPPEAREDRGELERATPWDLVETGMIRAELHAHTTASDGALSIEELAAEAKRRGFHTIAVTDHSQSSTIANGLRPDRLRRHIDAVRQAAANTTGITILAGSEVDILADGTLDYDDELLALLDVVVASPHAALSQDPATCTARLLRAIRHPLVHVLGHPTGRLINRRTGLAPAMADLYAAAREHRVALEVNAHWMRLDLRDVHVRGAVDAGCLIAINCDVHARADFDNLSCGVATARRGWCPADRCLNTWDAPRLHAWLRSKGQGGAKPDLKPAPEPKAKAHPTPAAEPKKPARRKAR